MKKERKGILEGEDIIHTVVRSRSRDARGFALGINRVGEPYRLALRTERAMNKAIDRVEAFGRLLEMKLSLQPAGADRCSHLMRMSAGLPTRELR